MKKTYKTILIFCLLFNIVMLFGCRNEELTIKESYSYSSEHGRYVQPALIDGWIQKDALTTTVDGNVFFCFTSNAKQADDFVNLQRTLLQFLYKYGVNADKMKYYATDYGYSFSESDDNAVYISLSDLKSWQQVLVTLQGIFGDYTDYGYVYALSNTIAMELGWETDIILSIGKKELNTFFFENPEAIQLLYPTFTTEFATEEMVNNSKYLAMQIFKNIEWKQSLKEPISKQLDDYYLHLSSYANNLSISFERQLCGYAFYGKNVKLRIMTTYAELIIDSNYRDTLESLYGDYWGAYQSIYETANTINNEITTAVEYFELTEHTDIITIKFLDSKKDSTKNLFGTANQGLYYASTHTAYIISIRPYLHEFYHHIEYLLIKNNPHIWQSQAFCEIGSSNSKYAQLTTESTFGKSEAGIKIFDACVGRPYEFGRNDFFESWDILCYINNYYKLEYLTGAQSMNSFSRYLIDLYGERTVYNLMLYPKTIEEVTDKTWEQLALEWETHIRNKYKDVDIP